MKPVSGATLETLDRRRLRDYFVRVLSTRARTLLFPVRDGFPECSGEL